MSDAAFVNSALAALGDTAFVPCDDTALDLATALADVFATLGLGPAGGIGCLARAKSHVLGFSERLGLHVRAHLRGSDMAQAIAARCPSVRADQIHFAFAIVEEIADLMGDELCAEKFIYSTTSTPRTGPLLGAAVVWYPGRPGYRASDAEARAFVPDAAGALDLGRISYLPPCDDCIRISKAMRRYADAAGPRRRWPDHTAWAASGAA